MAERRLWYIYAMQCPNPSCPNPDTRQQVRETHPDRDGVRRKRHCAACGSIYTTVETVTRGAMTVVKADGRQANFNADTLLASVDEATKGWHSPEQLLDIVRAVKDEIFRSPANVVITSSSIGQSVLRQLKHANAVSHIRFALAFVGRVDRVGSHGMRDARDFRVWLIDEYPHLRRTMPPAPLSSVLKVRTNNRVPFDRDKLKASAKIACLGRGTDAEVDKLASRATNAVMRALGTQPIVTTGQLIAEMLKALRSLDDIAYLRYASIVKQFSTESDYDAEALSLANERRSNAQ